MRYLTAGESHGPMLTAILDGYPAGVRFDKAYIDNQLKRRQSGYGRGERMRIEADRVEITAGVRGGLSLGSPIGLVIRNLDHVHFSSVMAVEGPVEERPVYDMRPGHADYAGCMKYKTVDARNILERASGRESAIRTAVGACARMFLETLGVRIASRVTSIGSLKDMRSYEFDEVVMQADMSPIRCMDRTATEAMIKLIDSTREQKDTLGGEFIVSARGMKPGVGSFMQFDRKLDYDIMSELGSLQAVKSVGIGLGALSAERKGTNLHDEMYMHGGVVKRRTNNAGGIEGGVSNGEEIVVRVAVKPIPTVLRGMSTVNLSEQRDSVSAYERSDICVVPAASVVCENLLAIVLARQILLKTGGDTMSEILQRWQSL